MKKTLAVVASVAAAFVLGAFLAYGRRPAAQTIYRDRPIPYVAPASPLVEKVEKVEECVPTVVYRPTPEQKDKIEKKLGVELPPGPLLSLSELRPLPYGGTLAVSAPAPDQPVSVTVVPAKAPFFELDLSREIGVSYGIGRDGNVFAADLAQNLFRVGPVRIGAHVGAIGDRWIAGVRASARF